MSLYFGVVLLQILVDELLASILKCIERMRRRLPQKSARCLILFRDRHVLIDLHTEKLFIHGLYLVSEILGLVLLDELAQVEESRLCLNIA